MQDVAQSDLDKLLMLPQVVTINAETLTGKFMTVNTPLTATMKDLNAVLSEQLWGSPVPHDMHRLMLRHEDGKMRTDHAKCRSSHRPVHVEDANMLWTYGAQAGCTIVGLLYLRVGPSPGINLQPNTCSSPRLQKSQP